MRPKLSPLVSRLLALAILATLLVIVFTGIAQPLLGAYRNAVVSAEEMRSGIMHVQTNGRSLAQLQAEVAQLTAREQSTPGFLRGTNEALAAAELQERVKSVVAGVNAELRSTLVLPAPDEAKLRRISIRSQIVADVEEAQRVFYQLESGSPTLFLDNVQIQPGPRGAIVEPPLDVRFDLYGYMRSPS
jgi:general secretion pathway protein M